MSFIPYGRQDINAADIKAVVDVLQSDFITQGPAVPAFEKRVADYCGASHAVAVNSATSALHIACLALGVCEGDTVWTSPITFVASANCALYCGAEVDFVDIDAATYNLSVDCLTEKLEKACKLGKLPKVVIPVHLAGQSCDMEAIFKLGQQYGFKIIEDASHAIGGQYKGAPIGNCQYSDIAVFSFHPVKIITTAEGGMAVTNQQGLADKMAILRSHGVTRDPSQMKEKLDGPWYYEQIDLGYNYRMTELQAALGVSQMQRLDNFIGKRHEIARRYNDFFSNLPLTTPRQHKDSYSALHLYIIRLQLDKINYTHEAFFTKLRERNIGVNLHYIPIYRQPYYQKIGHPKEDYKNSNQYYAEAISLPMYPGLSSHDQITVCETIKKLVLN